MPKDLSITSSINEAALTELEEEELRGKIAAKKSLLLRIRAQLNTIEAAQKEIDRLCEENNFELTESTKHFLQTAEFVRQYMPTDTWAIGSTDMTLTGTITATGVVGL